MIENEISKIVVDTAYQIHVDLGPGLFESVYEELMYHELLDRGLRVTRQVTIPLIYKGHTLDKSFSADLIIENKVIVEVKSVEKIQPVHPKQVLTYLRLANLQLGLLINFNTELLKNGVTRIVNNLQEFKNSV
ncbi:MAG: GxxExxY protein [Flavobacteriales bacterium]|nr:GxxExxY protein [Flavobacteriales bacterium]